VKQGDEEEEDGDGKNADRTFSFFFLVTKRVLVSFALSLLAFIKMCAVG